MSENEEVYALKCLILLIGDIHQSLHVGNGTDRGGNDTKVNYFWEASNLHRVWDSGIIDGKTLSYTEYVAWIDHASKIQITQWKNEDMMAWVIESISFRSQTYDLPENKKINCHTITTTYQPSICASCRWESEWLGCWRRFITDRNIQLPVGS